MPPSIWATLGIEATRDRAVIRRAYAARLKLTNPEDDPNGFQALRAAYERALAYAGPPPRAGGQTRVVVAERPPKPPPPEAPPEQAPGPKPRSHDWRPPADPPDPGGVRRAPRDWRPPEPQRPEPTPPRPPRAWRPPSDPAPPLEVFDAATRRAFEEARAALQALVAAPGAAEAARLAALRALLASPMMEDVVLHDRTAGWLARLIADNLPRGDVLIDPVIAHFHWDEARVRPSSNLGAPVLARREDLRFLAATASVGNPHQGAYAALSKKPVGRRLAANRLTPGLAGRVRGLLAVIRRERPRLMASLDIDAVAWWDRYFERPRLGAIQIWLLALAPAALALAAAFSNADPASVSTRFLPGAVFVDALLAVGAGVLANLYAVAWPRFLWRRRWAAKAPRWAGVGWAPALGALVLAAGAIPPSLAATLAVLGLTAPALLWAIAVGEPDRREFGSPPPGFRWRGFIISYPVAFAIYTAYWGVFRPGVRFAWPVRTAFSFIYLAVFWLIVDDRLPAGAWAQMLAPAVAAAIAFAVGAGTLLAAWQRLRRPAQLAGLVALALVVAAALGAVWMAASTPAVRPLAAALVLVAVVAHKASAESLASGGRTFRDLAMRYGWIVIAMVAAQPDEGAVIGFYGLLITPGLIIALVRLLSQVKPGDRRAALQRAAAGVARYGLALGAPLLLPALAGPQTGVLAGGAVWLMTGVTITILGLIPAPWPAKPPRTA